MHSNIKSAPSRITPLSNLSNSLRRLSWGRPKSEIAPLPPTLKLKQMHQQHHSEEKENQIELHVIEETVSSTSRASLTRKQSTDNDNRPRANPSKGKFNFLVELQS